MKNRRSLITFFVVISTLVVQAVNISDCTIVRRNPWDGKVAVTYYVPEGGSDEKVSVDIKTSTGHQVTEYYETGYMLPPEPWRPEPAATLNGFYGNTEISRYDVANGKWVVSARSAEIYVNVVGPCKVCWDAPAFYWEREFGSDAYKEVVNSVNWYVFPSAKTYQVVLSCVGGCSGAFVTFKQMIRFGLGNSYLSAGWHTILLDDPDDGDDVEVSMSVGGVAVKTERIEQTKNNVVYHQKGKPLQVYLDPVPFEGVSWPSIFDGSRWVPMTLPSASYSSKWTGDSWASGEEKASEAFLLVNRQIVASSMRPTVYTWTPSEDGTNVLELIFVKDKKVVAPPLMAAVLVQSVDLRIEPRNDFGPRTYLQMTASNPAATIHYTLDGTDPTQGSPVFVPFELPETELTVRAVAVLPNGIVSDVVTQRLVPRRSALPTVRYSRGYTAQGGYNYLENVDIVNLTSAIRVHLSASDRYTVDGTEPTENSPSGSQPFWIEKDMTLKVKSFSSSAYPSEMLTLDFKFQTKPVVVQVKNPTIRYYAGMIHMNCPTDGAEIHYEVRTYNTIPTIDSPCYEEPLNVDSVCIVSAVAFPGLSSCNTKSGCSVFTVSPQVKNENDVVELPSCELWSSQTADMRTDSGWRPDWSVDCDEFHSGQSSLHSSGGTLDMVIPEDGTLTFWWKYTTSNSVGLEFDGVQIYDGIYDTEHSNWMKVRVVVEGNHIAVDDITGSQDKWLYSGTIRSALDLRDGIHVMRWRTSNQLWIDDLHWQSSRVSPIGEQEIIPELSETADGEQVKAALSGSVDLVLVENITDAATYNAYREWAMKIGAAEVKASQFAWASFATDSAALLAKMPTDEDLKVEEFKPSPTAGSFDFTVSVKDVKIGDKASVENLKKLFGLEGAESLDTAAFSSENVSLDFKEPQDGKLKFSATPAVDNAKSFFMKAKVK